MKYLAYTTVVCVICITAIFLMISPVLRERWDGGKPLTKVEVVNLIDSILDSRVTLEAEDLHDDMTIFEENTGKFSK